MPGANLVNGVPGDHLPIDDRGLAYGDGLFETIAVVRKKPQLLGLHLQRLRSACLRLAIDLDLHSLNNEIEQILSSAEELQVYCLKIIITRQSSGRGYRYDTADANRILQLIPNAYNYGVLQAEGVRVRFCHTALSINTQLAGIKHLCRLENVLARAEWHDESIYEGVMLDSEGYVVEAVMSNIFIVKDNLLLTPHLDRCGVAGVVREFLLTKLAPELQIPASVDRVLLEQLHNADELFICNSLMGIVPVVAAGQFAKKIGPITLSLQQALSVALYD